MPLAHLEQAQGLVAQVRAELLQPFEQAFQKAPGVAVALAQPQPQAAPRGGQALAELHGQRALAETGGRRNQQQSTAKAGVQALA